MVRPTMTPNKTSSTARTLFAAALVLVALPASAQVSSGASDAPTPLGEGDLLGSFRKDTTGGGVVLLEAVHAGRTLADQLLAGDLSQKKYVSCDVVLESRLDGALIGTKSLGNVVFTQDLLRGPPMATASMGGLAKGNAYYLQADGDCDGVQEGYQKLTESVGVVAAGSGQCATATAPYSDSYFGQRGGGHGEADRTTGTGKASVEIGLAYQSTRDSAAIAGVTTRATAGVTAVGKMVAKGTSEGELHAGVGTHPYGNHHGSAFAGLFFTVWTYDTAAGDYSDVTGAWIAKLSARVGQNKYDADAGGTAGINIDAKDGYSYSFDLGAYAALWVQNTGGAASVEQAHFTSVAWCPAPR